MARKGNTSLKSSKSSAANQDRFLISEQPGMAILGTGIAIALLVGLVVKSLLSPARVQQQIERAAAQMHREVRVHFEKAEFILSQGILPRFSVVISQVRMESDQDCWMKPVLSVDEIRLPISLTGLLRGQGAVSDIYAGQVQLNLRSDRKDCPEKGNVLEPRGTPAVEASVVVSNPPKLVQLDQRETSDKYANSIRSLSFDGLEINWPEQNRPQLKFRDLRLQVKKLDPRWYLLTAKTSLFKDEQVGDYLSHANLHVEYKESPEPVVQAHFFGNWREGHYSLIGNYSFEDRGLTIETDLKHIPLSQITALAQKYSLVDRPLRPRQAWVSLRSRYAGTATDLEKKPWELTDFKIEGDLGEIRGDRLRFQSLKPLRYEALRIDVQRLNIEKLLNFLDQQSPGKIFGSLGQFSGRLELVSPEELSLFGDWSGLEFIFSNKGRREIQAIRSIRTEASLANKKWKLDFSRVEPEQGVFRGQASVTADQDFDDMNVKLRLDEVILSQRVQSLMTQGGEIGALNSQVDLSLKDGKITKLDGDVKLKKALIEGIEMDAPRGHLNWKQKEVSFNFQSDRLRIASVSAASSIFNALVNEGEAAKDIAMNSVRGEFRTVDFKSLGWKNFSANLSGNARMTTEGGWDEAGKLRGRVILRDPKQKPKDKTWEIGGTREAPLFFKDR